MVLYKPELLVSPSVNDIFSENSDYELKVRNELSTLFGILNQFRKNIEETRKKMSEMAKQRKDNPMRGKNHTEEFKDRMSDKKSVYSYINMDDMIYYKSARELTNNGYSKDCINSACRIGHYRKANGKHWIRFEKEKSPYLLDILYSKLTIEYKRELLYAFIQ